MAAPRVFVSHSHLDDALATQLANDLRTAGAHVFIDIVDITANDFMERINDALSSSGWMVLILTPHSIASNAVKMEVNATLNRVRINLMQGVIPVLAAPCDPSTVPPLWATLHYYDATRNYTQAVQGLLVALGLSMTAQPVPTSTFASLPAVHADIVTPRPAHPQSIPIQQAPAPANWSPQPAVSFPPPQPQFQPVPATYSLAPGRRRNTFRQQWNAYMSLSKAGIGWLALAAFVLIIAGAIISVPATSSCATATNSNACLSANSAYNIANTVIAIGSITYVMAWLPALWQSFQMRRWGWFCSLLLFSIPTIFIYAFRGPVYVPRK